MDKSANHAPVGEDAMAILNHNGIGHYVDGVDTGIIHAEADSLS